MHTDDIHQSLDVETLHGFLGERPIAYQIVNGLAIIEGDIALGPAEEISSVPTPSIEGTSNLGVQCWPGGFVFYEFDKSALNVKGLKALVEQAMQHWRNNTAIDFIETTKRPDRLLIKAAGGCYSSVGFQGGIQEISVGPNCGLGSIIHELGHAIGLAHEHARPDRDKWVTVDRSNIDPMKWHNFNTKETFSLNFYDYESIMHYGPTAFAIDPTKPTIIPKIIGAKIGQRLGLSLGDLLMVNYLYRNYLTYARFPQFKIRSVMTNGVLDIKDGSKSDGAYVIVYPDGGTKNQLWAVNGYANTIASRFSDTVLDARGGKTDNWVVVWGGSGDSNQKWYFDRVNAATPNYRIRTMMNDTHCLTVEQSEGLYYTNVRAIDPKNHDSQFWKLEPVIR